MISAVADLKVRQIVSWRNERIKDSQVIRKAAPMIRLIEKYYSKPASLKTELVDWLKSIVDNYEYESLVLLDVKKKVRLSVGYETAAIGKETIRLAGRALKAKEIIFSGLRQGEVRKVIRADLFIPLFFEHGGKSKPVGIMILRTDPYRSLYPILMSWPTPSTTAETLLVRRDGDNVLFLNELRHKKGTALKFRMPLSKSKLPSVMAVRGEEDTVEGIDYRGQRVLAAMRAVNGSDMFMVSKIDIDEVYTGLRRQAWMIMAVIISVICAAGAFLTVLWRKQEADFYRDLYESERSRQSLFERYEIITQNASDIIMMMDEDWKITEVNERAVATYGYRREELIGMDSAALRNPSSLTEVELEMASLDRTGHHIFETLHRCSSGEILNVEVSATKLKIGGKMYFLEIVRDITGRKKSEEEREELISGLQEALAQVKTLSGLLPICSSCKKIRNDGGYWEQIETYIRDHSEAEFSHGICPECAKRLYPELFSADKL